VKRWASLLVAGLIADPSIAFAQAYQCRIPQTVAPVAPVRPDGAPRRVAVAGYTLAASWSPDYCHGARDTSSMQCSGRNGRFGFVLHGLWPEAARGPAPQWCANVPSPSPDLLRRHLCMTPSPSLMAHEWARHGSCMTKSPRTYFKVSAILWRSIRWPDADRLSRKRDLTVGDLREAFVFANPDWRRDQVGVQVSRSGWLREVHLCYDRKFLPAKCSPYVRGAADSAPLRIWRGL